MPLCTYRPLDPRPPSGGGRPRVLQGVAPTFLALTALVLVTQVLTSCGGGPPDDGTIREAEGSAPNKIYWAGRSIAGLPVAAMNTDGPWITFVYGDCSPDRDANCTPPLTIQTVPICDLNPLNFEAVPRASTPRKRWRHIVVRKYGDGRRMVNIGASTVIMYGRGSLGERALAALRPVGEAAGTRPLRARYPRKFVAEVRRVHDAYVRLGSVRAVRDELGISQTAVRFRLKLAKELGTRRLDRPGGDFLRSLKDIPVATGVDAGTKCEVEPF